VEVMASSTDSRFVRDLMLVAVPYCVSSFFLGGGVVLEGLVSIIGSSDIYVYVHHHT
jgi:hypothetical protein